MLKNDRRKSKLARIFRHIFIQKCAESPRFKHATFARHICLRLKK